MRFLRNRVRRDLLPAFGRVSPSLETDLRDMARHAARWRAALDRRVANIARLTANGQRVSIAVADVSAYSPAELAVVWPAVAARVGLAMDWRGTQRAAAFTTESRVGARIPLSGGWEISRTHDRLELARGAGGSPQPPASPLADGIRWDGFKFVSTRSPDAVSNAWVALLPANLPLTVRRWEPGDRMQVGDREHRKVKRFLSDARVSGTKRGQWPVVLAGDKIVWIPGVRRSEAASVRPGRPGVLYRCELEDR
jgi:tRNA(Ile)-lysidine synthetase-like protein